MTTGREDLGKNLEEGERFSTVGVKLVSFSFSGRGNWDINTSDTCKNGGGLRMGAPLGAQKLAGLVAETGQPSQH